MRTMLYISGISHSVALILAAYSHTLGLLMSKLRSSLEAGKKQPRVGIEYVCSVAKILRFSPSSIKEQILANLKETLSASIPSELPEDQKEEMLKEMLAMYSNPDELEKYASDDVFQDSFWNNISYQVGPRTPAFKGETIDVDSFMQTPMQELTALDDRELSKKCKKNETVEVCNFEGKGNYNVSVGTTRYLWLATRMGQTTIKDAPGLEVIQTYNLIKE